MEGIIGDNKLLKCGTDLEDILIMLPTESPPVLMVHFKLNFSVKTLTLEGAPESGRIPRTRRFTSSKVKAFVHK
jgi:hypothetical protein